jgi:hypothetical protein
MQQLYFHHTSLLSFVLFLLVALLLIVIGVVLADTTTVREKIIPKLVISVGVLALIYVGICLSYAFLLIVSGQTFMWHVFVEKIMLSYVFKTTCVVMLCLASIYAISKKHRFYFACGLVFCGLVYAYQLFICDPYQVGLLISVLLMVGPGPLGPIAGPGLIIPPLPPLVGAHPGLVAFLMYLIALIRLRLLLHIRLTLEDILIWLRILAMFDRLIRIWTIADVGVILFIKTLLLRMVWLWAHVLPVAFLVYLICALFDMLVFIANMSMSFLGRLVRGIKELFGGK